MKTPVVYDVVQEYSGKNGHDGSIHLSPGWCLAVVGFNRPLTYSRKLKKAIGDPASGAQLRGEKPLIIFDDCLHLSISRSLKSHTKSLNATLKSASVNYLSASYVLPGDWIFAWCHNDIEVTKQIISKIQSGRPANDFMSGLKFIGRVHSVRRKLSVNNRVKSLTYSLSAVGFQELDTQFYYDLQLAGTLANGGPREIAKFMAQLGLDWTDFAATQLESAGTVKDNMSRLVPALINAVIGKGGSNKLANTPRDHMYEGVGGLGVENNQLVQGGAKVRLTALDVDVPYAYMIPAYCAKLLGKTSVDKTKPNFDVFGYSDILRLLIGVQEYDNSDADKPSKGFWPILQNGGNTESRYFCQEPCKGTYLVTQEATFINRPLWQILEQFLNHAINDMYTALKVGPDGLIYPTLVVRQIPFSTQVIDEDPSFKLTRFLEMPRWKIDPVMVSDLDVGRSDATHINMVKLTGDLSLYSQNERSSPARAMIRNPPIFDDIDIGRSGIHSFMATVNCTLQDVVRVGGLRTWTVAVADWQIGSQYTLNGTMVCSGIQTPIAEGDNIEFEGIVYHIDGVSDNCSVSKRGKTFSTTLYLTNGMPSDQMVQSPDFPRYPGFIITATSTPVTEVDNENQKTWTAEVTNEKLASVLPDAIGQDLLLSPPSFKPDITGSTDDISGNDGDLTAMNPGLSEER